MRSRPSPTYPRARAPPESVAHDAFRTHLTPFLEVLSGYSRWDPDAMTITPSRITTGTQAPLARNHCHKASSCTHPVLTGLPHGASVPGSMSHTHAPPMQLCSSTSPPTTRRAASAATETTSRALAIQVKACTPVLPMREPVQHSTNPSTKRSSRFIHSLDTIPTPIRHRSRSRFPARSGRHCPATTQITPSRITTRIQAPLAPPQFHEASSCTHPALMGLPHARRLQAQRAIRVTLLRCSHHYPYKRSHARARSPSPPRNLHRVAGACPSIMANSRPAPLPARGQPEGGACGPMRHLQSPGRTALVRGPSIVRRRAAATRSAAGPGCKRGPSQRGGHSGRHLMG